MSKQVRKCVNRGKGGGSIWSKQFAKIVEGVSQDRNTIPMFASERAFRKSPLNGAYERLYGRIIREFGYTFYKNKEGLGFVLRRLVRNTGTGYRYRYNFLLN